MFHDDDIEIAIVDPSERGQWSTGPISGQGGVGYQIEFGIDGSVRRFERLR
nr:hypothetical protein [Lysobacter enzymogenes]